MATIERRGRRLLNQQCWLWGQDIKREEGNLLLEYGFERVRPPSLLPGPSQYTLSLDEDLHIRLWGFGLYCGHSKGIFINRFDLVPRVAELSDGWQGDLMRDLPRSADRSLMSTAFRWIGSYEGWVMQRCSAAYREKCLLGWKQRASSPLLLSDAWLTLAIHLDQYCERHPLQNKLAEVAARS